MPRVAPTITVSDDDRFVLLRWSKGRRTPARLVRRAKIVLRAADGWLNMAIAVELGTKEKEEDQMSPRCLAAVFTVISVIALSATSSWSVPTRGGAIGTEDRVG